MNKKKYIKILFTGIITLLLSVSLYGQITGPSVVSTSTYYNFISPLSNGGESETEYKWIAISSGVTINPATRYSRTASISFSGTGIKTFKVTVIDCDDNDKETIYLKTVTISSIPTRPGSITGASTVCGNSIQTYSISPVSGATSYYWRLEDDEDEAIILSGQGTTSISVKFGDEESDCEVRVRSVNSIGSSQYRNKDVEVTEPLLTPGTITGASTVCTSSTQTYSISPVPGATSYYWNDDDDSDDGSTILSGQGTTSISVKFGDDGTSGYVRVRTVNSCGNSSYQTKNIIITGAPSTPATINGASSACAGTTQTYSVTPVPGAIEYDWNIPVGSTINGDDELSSISVTLGSTSGNISVKVRTSCGWSGTRAKSITINSKPSTPGTINGPSPACAGSTRTYSIDPVTGATSYNWRVPPGTTINSGQGTNSISVTLGSISDYIEVKAINSCGETEYEDEYITINSSDAPTHGPINGNSTVCAGSSQTYYIDPVPGAEEYEWDIPNGSTFNSGREGSSISITVGSTSGNVSVEAHGSCWETGKIHKSITITSSVPTTPTINGASSACAGSTQTYSVTPVSGAIEYDWNIPTGSTINGDDELSSISVTLGSTSGNISVKVRTSCGWSGTRAKSITINSKPSTPGTINGPSPACAGSTRTYSIDPVTGATSYNWRVPPGTTINSGQGTNSISVTLGSISDYIEVKAINSCGETEYEDEYLTINNSDPPILGPITGASSACAGSTLTYSVVPVPGATEYEWYIPNGSTFNTDREASSISITLGSTSGNISVQAGSSCWETDDINKSITINSTPSTPGTITGSSPVYAGTTQTYSIGPVSGATSYNWLVPSGSTINSGQGTTSISVTMGSATGNVSVRAENSCGNSSYQPKSITIGENAVIMSAVNENFIHTTTPTIAYTSLPEDGSQSIEQVSYFDGLGRPIQSVQIGTSPSGKDIIQHITYDDLGRETRKYLPYVSEIAGGAFRSDAETRQLEFYKGMLSTSTKVAISTNPWADIEFEKSPLNRVLEQGAPGEGWQVKTDGNGNTVRFAYETNTSNEVIHFEVGTSNQLVKTGTYNEGRLYKNATRDENKVWGAEYKNNRGQVLLKVADTTNLKLSTYYVYDDYGLLRYVLPPKAVELLDTTTVFDTSHAVIKNLCYYYEYDARKRMSLKKLPGAEPVYMVYDNRDRLVLTQDGNLRNDVPESAPNEWMFTKYDALNRPVMAGVYYDAVNIGQENMQAHVNTQWGICEPYESYDGLSSTYFGYDNQSFPQLSTNYEILTVTYYDNYDFDTGNTIRNYVESISNIDYPVTAINYNVKGQVTGTLTKVLGTTNQYLMSLNLYDDKYRVIRTYNKNYLGGNDLFLTKYDFIGNILKTQQIHVKNTGAVAVIINQEFDYDHAFRLTEVYHQVEGNGDPVLMAEMEYNELGQLINKKLHETAPDNFLQDVNFEYNIRGWMTKINNPEGIGPDLFAMQLAYNNPITGVSSISDAQYNGNISAMVWKAIQNKQDIQVNDATVNTEIVSNYQITVSPGTTLLPGAHLVIDPDAAIGGDAGTTEKQAYVFTYDKVNRIKKGDYKIDNEGWANPNSYDLEFVDYDSNGNINILKRYGESGTYIDNLVYDYLSGTNYTNQLRNVTDNGDMGLGFYDKVNAGIDEEYLYDANGNMIVDDNKGLDVYYNYLNLPKEIDFGGGNKIKYIYDAAGVKLAKETYRNSTLEMEVAYTGNIIYEDVTGDDFTLLTSEGKVTKTSSVYTYEYYLKDHLGNTRVMFHNDGSGNVVVDQVNNYYPFGMLFEKQNLDKNKYLYNGKELQEDVFNGVALDLYDYGWRHYDAALGRWYNIDPLADEYIHLSPYSYVANNPLIFIDPDGKSIYIVTGNKSVEVAKETLLKTTLGKELWGKYANSNTHDIYITCQKFNKLSYANGAIYSYAEKQGLLRAGKVNLNLNDEYQKDFSTLNGIDISKSLGIGRSIHLMSLNEDNFNKGSKFDNAETLFHEIKAHVDLYLGGDAEKEHKAYGVTYIKLVNGGYKAIIRRNSAAFNILEELRNVRNSETPSVEKVEPFPINQSNPANSGKYNQKKSDSNYSDQLLQWWYNN